MDQFRGHKLRVQNTSSNTASSPQMYAVPGGSYYSNASYGSGIQPTMTYDNVTIPSESALHIRNNGKETDFSLKLVLNTATGTPLIPLNEGEIRFKTKFVNTDDIYQISTHGAVLPQQNSATQLPLFETTDIHIINPGFLPFPASQGGRGTLKARLLNSGELALVNIDYINTSTEQPITTLDISLLFGEGSGNTTLLINGTYLHR